MKGGLGDSRGEWRWLGTVVMMMMTWLGVCIYFVERRTLLERHACGFVVSWLWNQTWRNMTSVWMGDFLESRGGWGNWEDLALLHRAPRGCCAHHFASWCRSQREIEYLIIYLLAPLTVSPITDYTRSPIPGGECACEFHFRNLLRSPLMRIQAWLVPKRRARRGLADKSGGSQRSAWNEWRS